MKAYETKKKLALSLAVAMVASSAPVLAFADTAIVAQAEAEMTVEEIIASVSAAINDPFLAAGLARIEAGEAAVATLPDGATKTALTETLQTARHMYDGLEQINQIWVALGAAGWQTNYGTEVAELQAIIAQLDAAFPGGSAFLNNFKTAVTETGLTYAAFEAMDVAAVNPTAANIAAAKEAVSKIMNPVAKANAQLRIETEIENQKLAVVSVSAITKTGVEVTIKETAEAMEDVTVEVKNNNGVVVAVKAVNLVKGETVAVFPFVTALAADPEGVWTVGGVTIDLDLAANLKAVYTAANQVKLLEGLNKLELTDVKADNIAFYQTELNKIKDSTKDTFIAEADFTKEDAQALVTAGNEAAAKAGDVTAQVKAVNDATTQVALLNAFAPFSRVNSAWITEYEAALSTPYPTTKAGFDAIQTVIDGVNTGKINPALAALNLDSNGLVGTASIVRKDLADTRALVVSYIKEDTAGVTTKAEALRKIDRQVAIINVLDAETPAQLTVAINALKTLDVAFELNMTNYKDANRAAYITAMNATSAGAVGSTTEYHPFNTIARINATLAAVNTAQAVSAPQAIKDAGAAITDVTNPAINTTARKAALLSALKAYDVKYVADANRDFYAGLAVNPGTDEANKFGAITITGQTPTQIRTAVQALVNEANLAAINGAADADKTYAALVAYGNDIKDLSISNKAEYHTAFNGNNIAAGAVQTTVDTANILALQAQINSADGVLAKLNIMTQVKNVNPAFSAAYLADVQDSGTAGTLGHVGTNTVALVQARINAINAAQATDAGIKAVNDATTATALRDILTDLVVDGDISANSYLNLTNADKLIAAELFMDDDVFTTNGLAGQVRTAAGYDSAKEEYTKLAAIETDIAKVATELDKLRTDMNNVFKGNTVGDGNVTIALVQAELDKLVKANYTAYDELTGTQKLAATEAFIAAFPVDEDNVYLGGYSTFGAYTAAVDAAIAAQ